MKIFPTEFDGQTIRRIYDETTEIWWFSVIDVVQVLTESTYANRYWSDLKRKLAQEAGSEQPYEKIVRLKLTAPDGKQRATDCAEAETLLRIVQSIPSPKAEPIKLWLAKVGYERMQEMADPALSLDRARQTWQQHGRSDKWIQQRMTGQETRNKLTDYWADQARNFMRDDMQVGDGVLFYHSSCAEPGIVGIARVLSAALPDPTQFDRTSKYHDPAATPAAPRWFGVKVGLVKKTRLLPLAELRAVPALAGMRLLQRGNRLSITPVRAEEWQAVMSLLEPA